MKSADISKAGRREWLGIAVLALSALMLSVDISVLFLALPHLSADQHHAAVVDLRHLRLHDRRVSRHDGHVG